MKKKKTPLPKATLSSTTEKNNGPIKRPRAPKKTTTLPKPLINSNNATMLKKPMDTTTTTTTTTATTEKKRKMTDRVDSDKKQKLNHISSLSLTNNADSQTTTTTTTTTTAAATATTTTVKPTKTFTRRKPKVQSQSASTMNSNTQSKPQVKTFKKRIEPLPLLRHSYKLSSILKGHASDNSNNNNSSNLWACEFEPTTGLVALCGANNILFLNVQLGRYVKKYTHIEPKEEFLCLSWTQLIGPKDLLDENAVEDAQCNILAAAGQLGSIKLFNTLQNECFRYLFGHQKQVRKLQFSKSKPRWLFSCSEDMTVRLWDIGPPNVNDQNNSSMCLAKFSLPSQVSEPSAFCITPKLSMMMVGCMQGEMVRYDIKPSDIRKLENETNNDNNNNNTNETTSHSIKTFKHKLIYPSGNEWHEGYIDDMYILGQQQERSKSHTLDHFIVSRGSDDFETLVWDPKKSTQTDADIAISLEWPDSENHAGLRMKVVEQQGEKVLLAGDYKGQIRIFNIGNDRKSRTLDDGTKERFPPTKVS
ncbi:WD40-repeat-containing domain protein [Circinella umbellata]|nr:WD40-repeat-containing domain protein [Circinella umbellata]